MFGCKTGAKGLAGLAGVVGIQGSSQILASYPECIFCLISNYKSFLAAEILVQMYEGLFTAIALKGELIM